MAGRKPKYNSEEHQVQFQTLVYLKRQETPSGLISISDMVRFSNDLNSQSPEEYNAYNKDAWSVWGRKYIEEANKPLNTSLVDGEGKEISQLPNFLDIVEKYYHNKSQLIEHLLPCENLLHQNLLENDKLRSELNEVNVKAKELQELVKKYELLSLEMAHHSGIKAYREKYGLNNQISLKENISSIKDLDNLGAFLEVSPTLEEIPPEPESKKSNNVFIDKWKLNRNKK